MYEECSRRVYKQIPVTEIFQFIHEKNNSFFTKKSFMRTNIK